MPSDTGEVPAAALENEGLSVIELPQFAKTPVFGETFAAMQEWEGVVTRVGDELFFADLVDISGRGRGVSDTAELPLDDLDESDREKVQVGAIFRWVIGYARNAAGTKTRGSRLYFRRISSGLRPKPAVPFAFEE